MTDMRAAPAAQARLRKRRLDEPSPHALDYPRALLWACGFQAAVAVDAWPGAVELGGGEPGVEVLRAPAASSRDRWRGARNRET